VRKGGRTRRSRTGDAGSIASAKALNQASCALVDGRSRTPKAAIDSTVAKSYDLANQSVVPPRLSGIPFLLSEKLLEQGPQ
jgi:hypothetical protein